MILAIDPGTSKSAFISLTDGQPCSYDWVDNQLLLDSLYGRTVGNNKVQIIVGLLAGVVIEDITSYGMPVGRDVFTTVRWTGRFEEACAQQGLPVTYIPRKDAMLNLCGSARGNDATLRQAIIDRHGGDEVAIGGKKCFTCKGKGWVGKGRPPCPDCEKQLYQFDGEEIERGSGYQTPPGVLKGISGHVWSALGVGLTYLDTLK